MRGDLVSEDDLIVGALVGGTKFVGKAAFGAAKLLGKGALGAARLTKKAVDKKIQNKAASKEELELIKQISSPEPRGFIFGSGRGYYLIKPETEDGHILVVGGAGSGKSSCLAIPTLCSWKNSVFAVDVKGELYKKTARKRPKLKVFNPLAADSCGYDPFYLLNRSRNPAQDAREIALAIIPKPPQTTDPFWIEGAQNILAGAILHFWGQRYTFSETMLEIQSTPIEDLIRKISASERAEARLFVTQFIGMDTKTLVGIYSEVSNKIMVFVTDPDIKNCLSKTYIITPEDLERGNDIYLTIPEDRLDQWKGLLTLIINQFMKHFERRPDEGASPILFLLDEFPRLGKVEAVNGLATLRSKKITICLLVQSLAQLDAIYGKENRQVIADNCSYKAILNATDADTQDYFSRLVGTYDAIKTTSGENFGLLGLPSGTSASETTEEKKIIKPEEFATLRDVVLLTPYGFLLSEKLPYYRTTVFQA